MTYFIFALSAIAAFLVLIRRKDRAFISNAILGFARSMDRTSLYAGPRGARRASSVEPQ